MAKEAISVTLEAENITWLKGRVGASGVRSVSELLDQLVTSARASGAAGVSRSVVGTIAINDRDPDLAGADAAIRALFDASVARPMMVKERTTAYRIGSRAKKKARRG